jgi:hypothetical protein
MHLRASIGTGKAPVNAAVVRIALSRQGYNMLPQMIEALHALRQTASFKNADLNLGHIEPAAMFGRVMHLQSKNSHEKLSFRPESICCPFQSSDHYLLLFSLLSLFPKPLFGSIADTVAECKMEALCTAI